MLSDFSSAIMRVPVVRDHRGNLAFVQRTGFLPFEPAGVRWGTASGSLPALTGPAALILTGLPEELRMIPAYGKLRVEPGVTFIALTPGRGCDRSLLSGVSHRFTGVDDCRLIPIEEDGGGEYASPGSFPCRRIYYIYDAPQGAVRGGHSHLAEHRLLIALKGKMRVVVTDGSVTRAFHLSSPGEALYIPPGIWREIDSIEEGSVCLALSSTEYDADDYVRDFDQFKLLKRAQ